MGSNVGTALGIMGIIIGAGAIGFAFFVWNGQNTTNSDLKSDIDDLTDQLNNLTAEFNDLPRTIVVGEWNMLDDNYDYGPHNLTNDWLYDFGSNNLSNTDYIAVSNTNTRITLLKPGWYRIHLSVLLWYISPNFLYQTQILKDGANEFALDLLVTGSTVDSYWHNFDSSAFVYSDGTNYIELNGYSNGDDDFEPYASSDYLQLTIEYVAI